jgi:RND family efflux transporter MFP subunit
MIKKILFTLVVSVNLFALDTVIAKKSLIEDVETYNGDIYAKDQVMVATRLMGYMKSIKVEEGDRVKKGQFLFEVDPSDIYSMINQARAGMMQAQSAVLMAKLAYADAKKDYERFKVLFQKGAVSKRDFEKMELNMNIRESQIKLAQGMLNQAKAGLDQALAQQKYAKVTSPLDAVVISKMKKVAEMALPGHPVIILASLDSLQAKAFIKESDIKNVVVGQKAIIKVPSVNSNIKAKVSAVIPSADPATHSYLVKFSLEDKQALLPGMYAKIDLVLSKKEAILVPYNTLTSRSGVVGVFVLKDKKAHFKPVEVLKQTGDMVAISGLESGETVIEYPAASLKDGQTL